MHYNDVMKLIELRQKYNLSQKDAAQIAGIPLRTYIRYEQDENYGQPLKREGLIARINDKCEITPQKGILTIQQITDIVKTVIDKHYKGEVEYVILFGSYAKGYATEKSDVDLFVYTEATGFHYCGLYGYLNDDLHKDLDLVNFHTCDVDKKFLNEIFTDGIRIYRKEEQE